MRVIISFKPGFLIYLGANLFERQCGPLQTWFSILMLPPRPADTVIAPTPTIALKRKLRPRELCFAPEDAGVGIHVPV